MKLHLRVGVRQGPDGGWFVRYEEPGRVLWKPCGSEAAARQEMAAVLLDLAERGAKGA